MSKTIGLLERLSAGETVIVAEGYLFEFEARGYLKSGSYVPEVVLEHPDLVRNLHREFVHAGSDVVLAFTYYAHRQKLQQIGREDDLADMNRTALKLAREVADETGTLMAGNLSSSTVYKPGDPKSREEIYNMFVEQVKWAVEAGADYFVAETFDHLGEAMIALDAIKDHGAGLPAVITYTVRELETTVNPKSAAAACRALEEAGAAVVGMNCGRGPETMLPILKEIRKECKGPIAALPVLYRTDESCPVYYALKDIDDPDVSAFPQQLTPYLCSENQIAKFTREAHDLGVQYLGLCCGNRAHYLRAMAEAVGRKPPASRYSADSGNHYTHLKNPRYKRAHDSFLKSSSQSN